MDDRRAAQLAMDDVWSVLDAHLTALPPSLAERVAEYLRSDPASTLAALRLDLWQENLPATAGAGAGDLVRYSFCLSGAAECVAAALGALVRFDAFHVSRPCCAGDVNSSQHSAGAASAPRWELIESTAIFPGSNTD